MATIVTILTFVLLPLGAVQLAVDSAAYELNGYDQDAWYWDWFLRVMNFFTLVISQIGLVVAHLAFLSLFYGQFFVLSPEYMARVDTARLIATVAILPLAFFNLLFLNIVAQEQMRWVDTLKFHYENVHNIFYVYRATLRELPLIDNKYLALGLAVFLHATPFGGFSLAYVMKRYMIAMHDGLIDLFNLAEHSK